MQWQGWGKWALESDNTANPRLPGFASMTRDTHHPVFSFSSPPNLALERIKVFLVEEGYP